MDENEIQQLAEARGQEAVLCRVDGRDCWLMVDPSGNTLDKLAESLNTDSWCLWDRGLLNAYDKNGDLLYATDEPRDWTAITPIEFREMRWCVIEVTGMSQGKVIKECLLESTAMKSRSGMKSVQIRFLPKGSRGKEVPL